MSAKTHDLKCDPQFFPALVDGSKPFELRENDRDYEVGDMLMLHEYERCGSCHKLHPTSGHCPHGKYTGQSCTRKVTFKTAYAQKTGFLVMGLAIPDAASCLRFTCALCEHDCTVPIGWRIDLATGVKRICPGCHKQLTQEAI